MSIRTAEQIRQFVELQEKTTEQLRGLCEHFKLDSSRPRTQLVASLVQRFSQNTSTVVTPQAFSLCVTDREGNNIEGAQEALSLLHKMVFRQRPLWSKFKLTNYEGEVYDTELRYIPCNLKMAKTILSKSWYRAQEEQSESIQKIKSSLDSFNFAIIAKPDKKGRSWLMLHCEQKE